MLANKACFKVVVPGISTRIVVSSFVGLEEKLGNTERPSPVSSCIGGSGRKARVGK